MEPKIVRLRVPSDIGVPGTCGLCPGSIGAGDYTIGLLDVAYHLLLDGRFSGHGEGPLLLCVDCRKAWERLGSPKTVDAVLEFINQRYQLSFEGIIMRQTVRLEWCPGMLNATQPMPLGFSSN